jgi:hypothetical protein
VWAPDKEADRVQVSIVGPMPRATALVKADSLESRHKLALRHLLRKCPLRDSNA